MNVIDISFGASLQTYGGASTHTLFLAKYLGKKNKVNLIICGLQKNTLFTPYYQLTLMKFVKYKNISGIFNVLIAIIHNNFMLFIHLLTLKNYHIVYERFSFLLLSGNFYSRIKRIPLVYEVNGIPDEEMIVLFKIKNKYLKSVITNLISIQLKRAVAVIVQSEELKKILIIKFSLKKVFVVHNGVDSQEKLNIKKSDIPILVYSGVLDDLHNLDQIFLTLNQLNINFLIYIIGYGTKFHEYLKLYKKDKRFIFTGQLTHKKTQGYISNADICIASYSLEYNLFKKYGFYLCPLKLLEYSAMGKPTIIYGLSNSFTKKFEDKNACLTVNSHDDFIKAIKYLFKNKKEMEKMGRNARKIASKFTWELAANKTEAVLKYAVVNK